MKYSFLVLSFSLLLVGCKLEDSIISPSKAQSGKVLLKFDPTSIPLGINIVTATLTRQGFNPIVENLIIQNDSTAEISFQNLAVGTWHLLVQAKDSQQAVRYSGETDVNVLENQVTQVYLTLMPTGTGVGSIHIVVNWGTSSEIHWNDNPNNPVLVTSNSFYDYAGVSQCKILFDNNKYLMYHVGLANSGVGYILYAESQDGVVWSRPLSYPILTPVTPGSWDSRGIGPNAIIKEGNSYKLYYRGTNDVGESHVGLATSADGINFTKHPNPVLYSTSQEYNVGAATVMNSNGIYYMYYNTDSGSSAGLKIYLATSTDGINWTRYSGNPILAKTQSWEGTGIAYPSVIYDNNQFKMIYQMYTYANTAFGLAVSNDGKNWTKSNTNPIFTSNQTFNYWASGIDYPFLMKTGNEYRLYYSGLKNSNVYKIGFARKISTINLFAYSRRLSQKGSLFCFIKVRSIKNSWHSNCPRKARNKRG